MNNYKEALLKSLQEPATRAPAWSVQDMISRPLADVRPLAKASASEKQLLTLTSKPLSKASTQEASSLLPIPHGSAYPSLQALTVDVIKRCKAEGLSLEATLRMLKQVVLQFEGAAA